MTLTCLSTSFAIQHRKQYLSTHAQQNTASNRKAKEIKTVAKVSFDRLRLSFSRKVFSYDVSRQNFVIH